MNSTSTSLKSSPCMKKSSGVLSGPSCILDEIDLRLPTFWNQKDKCGHIEIGRNGLDLAYIGQGKDPLEAASVRANFPMRPQCGIYYFEMRVISKGDDGYIGIGFCGTDNKLNRLPGWDEGSWGYHGDDGHSFAGCGIGKGYGPSFTTGDTVGCGVNFADNTAFYTKNGMFLGTAFNSIKTSTPLFPCVGLRTPREVVTVNFGQDAFAFDIVQYLNDQKGTLWKTVVEDREETPKAGNEPKIEPYQVNLDQLILSYLVHHGYTGTAKAFLKDKSYVCDTSLCIADAKLAWFTGENSQADEENDMSQRQRIRTALISGQVDRAIELTQKYFPGVLDENGKGEQIMFELKCRKFVEMMSDYTEQEHALRRKNEAGSISEDDRLSIGSSDVLGSICGDEAEVLDGVGRRKPMPICTTSTSSSTPVSASGRRLSYAAIAASVSPTSSSGFHAISVSPTGTPSLNGSESTDIDEGISIVNRRTRRLSTRRSSSSSSSGFSMCSSGLLSYELTLEEEDEDERLEHGSTASLMRQVMKYGQQLQEGYRKSEKPRVRERLTELFSLLAYPDPSASPVACLMDKSGRDALATELNAAILVHQNYPEIPPLERIYRQTLVSRRELAFDGHGKAALISFDEQCAVHSLSN